MYIHHADSNALKIYPAYLDPFNQIIIKPSLSHIRRRIYIDAIMNEYLNPSLSHLLSSNLSSSILFKEPELLDEKIIIPNIAMPYDSIENYIQGRIDKFEKDRNIYRSYDIDINEKSYKKQLFSVYNYDTKFENLSIDELINKKIEFFSNHIKKATTYSPLASTKILQESVLRDFNDSTLLQRELLSIGLNKDKLNNYFSKEKYRTDRNLFLRLIEKSSLNDKQKNYLLSIINSNYYLGGVSERGPNCQLGGDLIYGKIYLNKFKNSFNMNGNNIINNELKYEIFNNYLDIMNISFDSIDKLRIDDLIALRKDNAIKKFRIQFNQIFKIMGSKTDLNENIQDLDKIKQDFIEAIEAEASKQKRLDSNLKFTKSLVLGISVIACGANFIVPNSTPEYSIIAGISGLGIVDPLIKKFEENKCNFIMTSEKIRKFAIK